MEHITCGKGDTVFVTGIGGFLGSHVAVQLMQNGYSVKGSLRSLSQVKEIESAISAEPDTQDGNIDFVMADLNQDGNWTKAIMGCCYVIHTASPFPSRQPKREDELIIPAREGTLRILRASKGAGVRRVVLTSSLASVMHGIDNKAPFDESDWTDIESPACTAYQRSKTLAERAAWDWVRAEGLELAVINPGFILGPIMRPRLNTSVEVVAKFIKGEFPAIPRVGFAVVDVRDVAMAHVSAMTTMLAAGERIITCGSFLWLREMAELLRVEFPERSARLPKGEMKDWLMRVVSIFDGSARSIVGELGRDGSASWTKANQMFGWVPRPARETLIDTVRSLEKFMLI